jgi:hypothetical protein
MLDDHPLCGLAFEQDCIITSCLEGENLAPECGDKEEHADTTCQAISAPGTGREKQSIAVSSTWLIRPKVSLDSGPLVPQDHLSSALRGAFGEEQLQRVVMQEPSRPLEALVED